MKRILLGLVVVGSIAASAPLAIAGDYGHGHRGPRGGHHGHYTGYRHRPGPPGPWCYPPPRVHYRPVPVPVAPVYPVYPAYPPPRSGFSYFSPGFSFSFSN